MREKTPPEVSQYPAGTVIADRYEVLQLLGWGAMGLVVKARDRLLNDEVVALKVLYARNAKDTTALARFRREIILSRQLGHDNIVRTFDIGVAHNGDFFITMEYVEGETLQKKLTRGPLAVEDAIRCIYDVALGLECAHAHTILHRDLKPTNIMIDSAGRSKIADFGTARAILSDEKLTQADELVGTPLFISPEAIRTGSSDTRGDIYALGAIAYTTVEGTPPFYSPNWAVLATMHLTAPIPPFKNEAVPLWYEEMTIRCLQKGPGARFQSAAELVSFIEEHLGKGATPVPRKTSWLIPLLALVTGLTLGILLV